MALPLCVAIASPLCTLFQAGGAAAVGAAGQVVDAGVQKTADAVRMWVGEAAGTFLQTTATGWVHLSLPGVTAGDDGVDTNPSYTVQFLQDSVRWLSLSILVITFIIAMGTMVFQNSGKAGIEAVKGIFRYIMITAGAVPIVGIATYVSKQFAEWIIEQSTGADFAAGIGGLLVNTAGLTLGVYLLVTSIAIFVSLLQIVLLIWRAGALVVLTASLGVPAAAATTEAGKQSLYKAIGWILAYVLYLPAAAYFYAGAFRMMSQAPDAAAGDVLLQQIVGVALMFLAVLALPAMIRLVAPAASAVASGRGFGAAAVGAIAIALPTGAVAAGAAAAGAGAAAAGANGGGGGGSSSGPTGATTPPPSSTPPPPPPPTGGTTASKSTPAPVPVPVP